MWKFVLISTLVAGASAGYASSQYAGAGTSSGVYNQVSAAGGQSSYADKYPYINTGYNGGGGFTSQFAGPNGAGAAAGTGSFGPGFTPGFAPFQPVPAFPNAFDFNGFYQGLQANFANSATQTLATAGATAAASASYSGQHHHYHEHPPHPYPHQQQHPVQQIQQGNSVYSNYNNQYQNQYQPSSYNDYDNNYHDPSNLYQQQLAHQNALFNSIRQQQAAFAANAPNYGPAGGSSGGFGGPGYAGASASYGPGGAHQTAHIYPENPASPNIDTRFGGDSAQGGQGRPGFVGVSSFSSSSNVNGQSHREASTTVNDNGKVTTYHVRS